MYHRDDFAHSDPLPLRRDYQIQLAQHTAQTRKRLLLSCDFLVELSAARLGQQLVEQGDEVRHAILGSNLLRDGLGAFAVGWLFEQCRDLPRATLRREGGTTQPAAR